MSIADKPIESDIKPIEKVLSKNTRRLTDTEKIKLWEDIKEAEDFPNDEFKKMYDIKGSISIVKKLKTMYPDVYDNVQIQYLTYLIKKLKLDNKNKEKNEVINDTKITVEKVKEIKDEGLVIPKEKKPRKGETLEKVIDEEYKEKEKSMKELLENLKKEDKEVEKHKKEPHTKHSTKNEIIIEGFENDLLTGKPTTNSMIFDIITLD